MATKTIRFKSTPENWWKEYLSLKCNTIREPEQGDIRFEITADYLNKIINLLDIEIENTQTHEIFTRRVTDITYWNGLFIYSWSPFLTIS